MMKIKIVFMCLIILSNLCLSQKLTDAEKTELLNNIKPNISLGIPIDCIEYNVVEAKDSLKKYISQQKLNSKVWFLIALDHFNSTELLPISKQIYGELVFKIDSLGMNQTPVYLQHNDNSSYLDYLVEVVRIQFKNNFEDNVNHVLGYVNWISNSYLKLLNELGKNDKYKNNVKNILIANIENQDEYLRYYIHTDLSNLLADEYVNIFIQKYPFEPSLANKGLLLKEVSKYKSSDLVSLYRSELSKFEHFNISALLIEYLLRDSGRPADYKLTNDHYLNFTPNEAICKYKIKFFKPPLPDSAQLSDVLADTLKSYNIQCNSYGWINDSLKTVSEQKIDDIRTKLSQSNIDGARLALSQYELWVTDIWEKKKIELPAYKFLKYYSIYTRERLN